MDNRDSLEVSADSLSAVASGARICETSRPPGFADRCMKKAGSERSTDDASHGAVAPVDRSDSAEPLEGARLQAEVAKQRVRIAKDELKRARKRLKEAKREAKNARRHASSTRKEWKRARRHAKRTDASVICAPGAAKVARKRPARARPGRKLARAASKAGRAQNSGARHLPDTANRARRRRQP